MYLQVYLQLLKLIDAIRIFWELDLLILAFNFFFPVLFTKFCKKRYKIVDPISCFPCNSTKYTLRLT